MTRRIKSTVASVAVVYTVSGCSHPNRSAEFDQPARPITAVEARAVGCYRLLTRVRDVSDRFSLLSSHGRAATPERHGRLVRPRGATHDAAYWHHWAGDTLDLVWTTVVRDSTTRNRRSITYWDALRARVALVGDTLRGRAVWNAESPLKFSPQSLSYDFRATRVDCPDATTR